MLFKIIKKIITFIKPKPLDFNGVQAKDTTLLFLIQKDLLHLKDLKEINNFIQILFKVINNETPLILLLIIILRVLGVNLGLLILLINKTTIKLTVNFLINLFILKVIIKIATIIKNLIHMKIENVITGKVFILKTNIKLPHLYNLKEKSIMKNQS